MHQNTVRALIALNNAFYSTHIASFSATRTSGWEGWHEVMRIAQRLGREACGTALLREAAVSGESAAPWQGTFAQEAAPLGVLDLAAGNLRFERFLAEHWPEVPFKVVAVDSCSSLLDEELTALPCTRVHMDILEALLTGDPLDLPAANLSVCFGFMHHVPTFELRAAVLRELVHATKPGGMLAVSFWQFMRSPRLAAQADKAIRIAQSQSDATYLVDLETGDHLLGWQSSYETLRYCHHTTDAELDKLVATLPHVSECARFSADGGKERLNRYVMLKKATSPKPC